MYRITTSAMVAIIILISASFLLAGEHELGVFVGDTRHDQVGALTLGAGYEYKWSATAGVGIVFEYAMGERHIRDYILGIPFYVHPHGGLYMCFAPLFVAEDHDGETVNRGALRVGFGYAIKDGNFAFTPKFNVDFIDDTAYIVYGLGFGYMF
ncbi:MAG: hypothetical protein PVJ42_02340 [bacterium]